MPGKPSKKLNLSAIMDRHDSKTENIYINTNDTTSISTLISESIPTHTPTSEPTIWKLKLNSIMSSVQNNRNSKENNNDIKKEEIKENTNASNKNITPKISLNNIYSTNNSQEKPAPVVEVEEKPTPVVEVEEKPTPVVEVEEKPAPVVEVEEKPAPVVVEDLDNNSNKPHTGKELFVNYESEFKKKQKKIIKNIKNIKNYKKRNIIALSILWIFFTWTIIYIFINSNNNIHFNKIISFINFNENNQEQNDINKKINEINNNVNNEKKDEINKDNLNNNDIELNIAKKLNKENTIKSWFNFELKSTIDNDWKTIYEFNNNIFESEETLSFAIEEEVIKLKTEKIKTSLKKIFLKIKRSNNSNYIINSNSWDIIETSTWDIIETTSSWNTIETSRWDIIETNFLKKKEVIKNKILNKLLKK